MAAPGALLVLLITLAATAMLQRPATLHAAEPEAASESPYEQTMDVVYAQRDGIGLLMDVFVPTGDKNHLAIVDIASGSWHSDRGKINDHKMAKIYDIMCSRGYTVFAVRPGSITKFSAPDMRENLNTAIRWVKQRAEEYDIDPDRVGLTGASAGGHLACLVSTTTEQGNPDAKDPLNRHSTAVAATVAFFPPTDFLQWGNRKVTLETKGRIAEMARQLGGIAATEELTEELLQEKMKAISPAHLVTSACPPLLLIHGDADFIVPIQQSERMLSALREAGVSTKLIVKKGGGHPWITIHEEVAVAADWIDQQLGNK
jgi:acetyl esterase/lipase